MNKDQISGIIRAIVLAAAGILAHHGVIAKSGTLEIVIAGLTAAATTWWSYRSNAVKPATVAQLAITPPEVITAATSAPFTTAKPTP